MDSRELTAKDMCRAQGVCRGLSAHDVCGGEGLAARDRWAVFTALHLSSCSKAQRSLFKN